MKRSILVATAFLVVSLLFYGTTFAQTPADNQAADPPQLYVVVKNDGTQFVGEIVSRDARELHIKTQNLGEIIIPMHEIREIREVQASELSVTGDIKPTEVFATRYFITTNGLAIKKGDSYIIWNLFGPDIQFGVSDNFGLGIMTTWFGTPLIGTAKYSFELSEKTSIGTGLLLGTGSWAAPDFGLILPYVALTAGNAVSNITFSFGYGGLFYKEEDYNYITNRTIENKVSDGRMLLSVAGMAKVGKKLSIVFDTFIVPRGGYYNAIEYIERWDPVTGEYTGYEVTRKTRRPGLALILPGIRLQTDPERAFQFGFGGLRYDGEFVPTPIPMVQWFRKL